VLKLRKLASDLVEPRRQLGAVLGKPLSCAKQDLTLIVQCVEARGDLGIVASRANAGGVQAVQWSLPG
jgi:hypothetical protein